MCVNALIHLSPTTYSSELILKPACFPSADSVSRKDEETARIYAAQSPVKNTERGERLIRNIFKVCTRCKNIHLLRRLCEFGVSTVEYANVVETRSVFCLSAVDATARNRRRVFYVVNHNLFRAHHLMVILLVTGKKCQGQSDKKNIYTDNWALQHFIES